MKRQITEVEKEYIMTGLCLLVTRFTNKPELDLLANGLIELMVSNNPEDIHAIILELFRLLDALNADELTL